MNFIAAIVVIALVREFLLHFLADFLNLRHLAPELPEAFRDTYDTIQYAKSQEYLRVNTRFGWIESSVNLSILLIFWIG